MAVLPEAVSKAWDERDGAVIFTTVDPKGNPNSIYVTCVGKFDDGTVVVADNYFSKTKKNILSGSRGALLFMTKEGKAYQLKGAIEYSTKGEMFDFMKCWNPKEHPGNAAAALKVDEVYSGAEKLL